MRESAKALILRRLSEATGPLPVHALGIYGVSDNAAATRLSELARDGLVVGVYVNGQRFKYWKLAAP